MAKFFKGLSVNTITTICILLVLLAYAIISTAIIYKQERKSSILEAKAKAQIILDRNLAIHDYYTNELKPKVFGLVSKKKIEKDFEPVLLSSTFAIRKINKYFQQSDNNEFYYKDAAINARNKDNEADEFEKAFIKKLNSDPNLEEQSIIKEIDGVETLIYLQRGLTMTPTCLRCHSSPDKAPKKMVEMYGKVSGYYRKLGETVSAVSLKVPMTNPILKAKETTSSTLLLLVTFLILAFILITQINRIYVFKPLMEIQRVVKKRLTTQEYTPIHLKAPIGKDIANFTNDLNSLFKQLHLSHESELKKQLNFMHTVIDSFKGSFIVIDPNSYEIKLGNKAFNSQRDTGTKCYQVLHGRDKPCHKDGIHCPMEEVKKTKKMVVVEHLHKSNDGNDTLMEIRTFPILDEKGEVTSIIEYENDISDRVKHERKTKQLLKQIEESNTTYELMFENQIHGIALHEVITDDSDNAIDYRFLKMNSSFEKQTGLKREDLIGKTVLEALPGTEKSWITKYGDIALNNNTITFTNYSKELDKYFQVAAYSPRHGEFVTIFDDITKSVKAEQEKVLLIDKLQVYNDELKNLLNIASHDLRAPLVNIEGFVSEMILELDKAIIRAGKESDKDFVKAILEDKKFITQNIKTLSSLIDGLVEIARIGSAEIDLVNTDTDEIVSKIIEVLNPKRNSNISITKSSLHPVTGENLLVKTIFTNLLSNAIKYGSIDNRCEIKIESQELPDAIKYTVSDSGPGVEEGAEDRIFDYFFRSRKALSVDGHGLGLPIIRWACIKMNGSIQYENAKGEGSKFHVTLPKVRS